MATTDPARVVASLKRVQLKNRVRKSIPPAVAQYQQMVYGHSAGAPLPRDPMQFLAGTFTPLTPIEPVPINVPDTDSPDDARPAPRRREMPVGWNMPVGVPGSEGFKLASFGTLRMYADLYSIARACIQLRKNEIRGLEWDIMPTQEAERRMRGDAAAHRDFAERRAQVVKFFRKPDPDYLSFGSYIDAIVEEMLVTDALSLYLHPTRKSGKGPFGSDVAALEIISGSTIRPLVNTRGGRVVPPSPGYQQYLYGVPRSDLMDILDGTEDEQVKELGKPAKEYRGDQLIYAPYVQRSWTPYGFPPLERTLIPTITGLRKQQFQMDFFDEGTIPGNYISPGESLGWTPNQLQIWQNQNNAIAGDPAWKHKSIALPPGSKVFPMKPIEIADQSDEVIMTQICMGYDIEPMELGISPKVSMTQSPGASNQMAKASQDKQERKSTKPTLAFLTDIFNVLIQDIWGQADMRFMFEGLEEDEDEDALVSRLVQMIQYGLSPIDEARIALGKSPYGLPITSDPVFVSPTAGMVPLGSIDPTTGKPMGTPPPAPVGAPPAPGGPPGAAGQPPRPGVPPAASPGGAIPGKPGSPVPAAKPDGTPPGQAGPQKPDKPHPDDKVGTSRLASQEAHAQVQQRLHEDFAAGKPLEPPVRPPVASEDLSADKDKPPSTKAMLSELDALRRHVKKGLAVTAWEARHLPELIVEHYGDLLKVLQPDDAAKVTRQFVIQCFGPPTIQAKLEEIRKVGPHGFVHGWKYVGIPGAKDSLNAHLQSDGTLDPDREKLHAQAVEKALAGHTPTGRKTLTMMGGGPASGKSTIGKPGADGSVVIDPDEFKKDIPEYNERIAAGDPSAAAYAHEESSALAKRATATAQARGLDITLDGTGDSSYSKLKGKVDAAHAAGYKVHGKYVTVDTDEAVKRAKARAAKTGRSVPEKTIRETHASVSGAFRKAAENNLFDSSELWDNNGSSPSLVAHKDEGGQFTVDDPAAWQKFLDKENEPV